MKAEKYWTKTPWGVGWRDRGHGHGDYGIIDSNGELIAEIKTGLKKDADVCAAGPELYVLLKACYDGRRGNNTIVVTAKTIKAMKAALEKAKDEKYDGT